MEVPIGVRIPASDVKWMVDVTAGNPMTIHQFASQLLRREVVRMMELDYLVGKLDGEHFFRCTKCLDNFTGYPTALDALFACEEHLQGHTMSGSKDVDADRHSPVDREP